jgi:hypothetical protein
MLDNFLQQVDFELYNLHYKAAYYFQEATGWSKDNLTSILYGTSVVSQGIRGSILYENDPFYMKNASFKGGADLIIISFLKLFKRLKMKKIEKVPEIEVPLEVRVLITSVDLFDGVIRSASGLAYIFASAGDPVTLREGIGKLLDGISLCSFGSAAYIDFLEMDPPSGKTLFSRLRQKLFEKQYAPEYIPN